MVFLADVNEAFVGVFGAFFPLVFSGVERV